MATSYLWGAVYHPLLNFPGGSLFVTGKIGGCFLMMLGMKKGQSILELMDNSEIKAVVSEIRSLSAVLLEFQKSVWAEFKELGFEKHETLK